MQTDPLALHPARLLELIRQRYGVSISFEFSRYQYIPRSLTDERETFQVPASHLSPEWVTQAISTLPSGCELALNSRVYLSPTEFLHIPMIDCAARNVENIQKISDLLPAAHREGMYWYNSGRSFHGYGVNLLTPAKWVEFMGRLLLVNRAGHPPVVDPRWIGHRLIGGYAALRWSWNTPQYLHGPRFIKTWMAPPSSE